MTAVCVSLWPPQISIISSANQIRKIAMKSAMICRAILSLTERGRQWQCNWGDLRRWQMRDDNGDWDWVHVSVSGVWRWHDSHRRIFKAKRFFYVNHISDQITDFMCLIRPAVWDWFCSDIFPNFNCLIWLCI